MKRMIRWREVRAIIKYENKKIADDLKSLNPFVRKRAKDLLKGEVKYKHAKA